MLCIDLQIFQNNYAGFEGLSITEDEEDFVFATLYNVIITKI